MLLYEHPLSSYAQKVKIALREKGVAFDVELPADFGTGRTDGPFVAANPRAEVPALIDGDFSIFESTIIMEYIEERWPEPALLPRDPAGRARARMIEDVCDTQYEAINWGWGEILWFKRAEGAVAERLRAEARRQTAVMQAWLGEKLGSAEWFGGETFGWADASVAPILNRSVHYGLGPDGDSALGTWHRRVSARPSVAATFREFDAAAAKMAAASEMYVSGARRREYRDYRLEWMIKSGGLVVVQAGLEARNIRFPWPGASDVPAG
ncbi:MAG: glutathione S-transferase family protein [Janthinobacterium lividum]